MLTAEQEKEIQEAEKEVDITLIRWMLSLTPLERLKVAERFAESFWRTKDASHGIRLPEDAEYIAEA